MAGIYQTCHVALGALLCHGFLLAILDGGMWVPHCGAPGALSLCMHLWNILQQGMLAALPFPDG